MKKILLVACLLSPLVANADRPPAYDNDCVNKKLPTVFDGSIYESINMDSLKKECALHGEYFTVVETSGNPDGGNMATWHHEFIQHEKANHYLQEKLNYIAKWRGEPNFYMSVTLTSTAF